MPIDEMRKRTIDLMMEDVLDDRARKQRQEGEVYVTDAHLFGHAGESHETGPKGLFRYFDTEHSPIFKLAQKWYGTVRRSTRAVGKKLTKPLGKRVSKLFESDSEHGGFPVPAANGHGVTDNGRDSVVPNVGGGLQASAYYETRS